MQTYSPTLIILRLVCIALALLSARVPALADDANRVVAGKKLAAAACAACHGLDGNAPNAQFPKLAGQLAAFTALQLRNYRSGERPNPIMAGIAKSLSDAQIESLAAYFASLTPMKPGAPACQYCHGAKGEGVAPVIPRLAGQHASFVYASLQPYKNVADFKNPYASVMKAVVENWSDDELKAVAAYISVLR